MTAPPDSPGQDLPVAYCAPGHLLAAEVVLAANGEQVAEVIEHPYLVGQDGVVLIAPPVESLLEVRFEDPGPLSGLFPKCGLCGWVLPGHSVTCAAHWTIHTPPRAGPLVTGVAGI